MTRPAHSDFDKDQQILSLSRRRSKLCDGLRDKWREFSETKRLEDGQMKLLRLATLLIVGLSCVGVGVATAPPVRMTPAI
jgi:hypothetical protein